MSEQLSRMKQQQTIHEYIRKRATLLLGLLCLLLHFSMAVLATAASCDCKDIILVVASTTVDGATANMLTNLKNFSAPVFFLVTKGRPA